MPFFDLPLEELREYQTPVSEPGDFDSFWQRTLDEARGRAIDVRMQPVEDVIYRQAEVHDVTFAGYGGQDVKAWLILPTASSRPLPGVVSFAGYGGGRSLPIDHLAPVVAGFAHFVMDTRGQGSGFAVGHTGDTAETGPHHPGFMTQGIDSPETYYYRRVFVDAVRAVEAAKNVPRIDPERLAVCGASQGGGIALAAAGLVPDDVKVLAADVPFLCAYRRATETTDRLPYNEITAYLKCHRDRIEQTFATLAYFDGVNFAARVRARSLFSVGLMDWVCPPSTVFAAYNRITADKEIEVYAFNEHEGGGVHHAERRLRFLAQYL